MDILVKTQVSGDINIVVPLVINTGLPDTGATVTVKAINPDGTENTAFTAPTISEVITNSGVYKLTFSDAAANKLFTLSNEDNPYTILVSSATSGSEGYRAIRVYCVDRLQGDLSTTTEVSSVETAVDGVQATVDAIPTLAEIEATTVLAKDATVAKAATAALETTVSALPTLAEIEATTVLAKEASIGSIPTLAEIEASTVLSKESTLALISKYFTNKKILTESGGVYSLVIYDDNDIDEILRKQIKDVSGADIDAIASGVIAREAKSSV